MPGNFSARLLFASPICLYPVLVPDLRGDSQAARQLRHNAKSAVGLLNVTRGDFAKISRAALRLSLFYKMHLSPVSGPDHHLLPSVLYQPQATPTNRSKHLLISRKQFTSNLPINMLSSKLLLALLVSTLAVYAQENGNDSQGTTVAASSAITTLTTAPQVTSTATGSNDNDNDNDNDNNGSPAVATTTAGSNDDNNNNNNNDDNDDNDNSPQTTATGTGAAVVTTPTTTTGTGANNDNDDDDDNRPTTTVATSAPLAFTGAATHNYVPGAVVAAAVLGFAGAL